jgi:transposase InsO family protein
VLLDDFTHYVWTLPVRQKSEVLPIIRSFFSYVHRKFRLPILALQTNNGKEFDSILMRNFLTMHGTTFRLSCPYTSQQNGKAERVLRTINDCVRTLLIHSAAPLTWTLVPQPSDARVITGKWVFTHKRNSDGSLARYKARWVVRGFHQ